jgi:pSer/pThr/pTyr-binding forkhead associated (FHA) protein
MALRVEILGKVEAGVFVAFPVVTGLELADGALHLGRSPQAAPALTLAHDTVSRRHARLWRDGAAWRLTDTGSSDNGTHRCDEPVAAQPIVVRDAWIDELVIAEPTILALGAIVVRLTPS